MLTSSDYINVIQYYWQFPEKMDEIDKFTLESLRGLYPPPPIHDRITDTKRTEIEQAIGATPIETVSVDPMVPLFDACRKMLQSRARRIPLIGLDDDTQQEMVVSVLTQFRILKFVAFNVGETQQLRKPLHELGIVGEKGIMTAQMNTPVIKVIHMLVEKDISSVPIVDSNGGLYSLVGGDKWADVWAGILLNIYESVDVLTLIKGGSYDDLRLSVGEALLRRPDVSGPCLLTVNIC